MTQLALWDFDDQPDTDKPLPEIIADEYGFALASHDVDGVDYYAVQDWIRGVAQSDDVRKFWNAMKRRFTKAEIQMSTWCRHLPYKATDGKTYQRDYATAEGLYLITQRMDAETGIRNKILGYLAKAGVILDEVRRNPDAAEQMIDALESRHKQLREKGKQKRNLLTATAQETHITGKPNYAALTNAEYEVLFGAAKNELVTVLGLNEKQAAKFRDHIGELAVQAIDVAETGAVIRMRQIGRQLTTSEQLAIVRESARLIAPGFHAMANYLNVDFLSGNALLIEGA
jgi:hypothetical protein